MQLRVKRLYTKTHSSFRLIGGQGNANLSKMSKREQRGAMTKPIYFTGLNRPQSGNDSGQVDLFTSSAHLGFEVVNTTTTDPLEVICVDWDPSDRTFLKWLKKNKKTAVLVINEPDVVIPEHSKIKLRKLFKRVVEVGRPFSQPTVPWPQTWTSTPEDKEARFSDRAVLIQSGKYSFVRGQLYGLRICLASSEQRIDVFGHGWTESPLRTLARLSVELIRAVRGSAKLDLSTLNTAFKRPINYLGSVESKTAGMSKYKVAIVIENSQEYMSEKLFDAFFARCIPVYVGAELEPFGIPEFLYVKANPNKKSVSEAISLALTMDYHSWRSQVDEFLDNPATRSKWDGKEANRRILEIALGREVRGA